MMLEIGHNSLQEGDRIADYIEARAERCTDKAMETGNLELRVRATTLNAVASDIRARLFEE